MCLEGLFCTLPNGLSPVQKYQGLARNGHLLSAENGPSRPGAAGLGLVAREFFEACTLQDASIHDCTH